MRKVIPVTNNHRRRVALGFALVAAALMFLTVRVAWIQIVSADDLTQKAVAQQTKDIPIEAKRGNIYDRNGKELATSIACYSLWARPSTIGESYTDAEIDQKVKDLAALLDMEEDTVKTRMTKKQALVRVADEIEKETADKIRELKISGLELSQGTKRYYPLGNFASQLLGSVTVDNTGRTGIELEYDQYLSGVAGRWVKNTDVLGNQLVDGSEEYHEAQNGLNVVLTIDEAIQYYVEKALEEGMKKTKADRIMCIVMDPETGEILASAKTPGFNPNSATQPDDKKEQEKFRKLSAKKQNEYLFKMWRNPIVSDTYEPGSTFKLITASTALEEGVITSTDKFTCNTKINVAGVILNCWSTRDHGSQTIKEAVGNSCNPVHAKIAAKIGKKTMYQYIDLYGITQKTGIDYPGESNSIMYPLESVGPVELATIGYGQSISLTPIQLCSAISAIGNDGVLLQPRYVKALTDENGKVVKEFEKEEVRKVLSEETAKEMCEIMEYVVSDGGGGTAKVAGFRVGGKTGTANKVENGKYGDYYYGSFIGMAPMNDPQVTCLVIVDSPKGDYYGSIVAGPIAKSILSDIMRYMNIKPQYTAEEKKALESDYTTVPKIVGKEYSEAVGILAGKDLECASKSKGNKNYVVVAQYPTAGTKVKKGTEVYAYKE